MFELSGDKNSLVKLVVWMGTGAGVVLILAMLMGGVFTADVKAGELDDMLDEMLAECNADHLECMTDAIDLYIDCEFEYPPAPTGYCSQWLDDREERCDIAWDECLDEVEDWFWEIVPTPSPFSV